MKNKSTAVVTSLGYRITPLAPLHKPGPRRGGRRPSEKARILVISGDPAVRTVTTNRLSQQRYATESVQSAEAGLDACVRSRPHLVIADLSPDEQTDFALLKELKSRWPRMMVIILTTHDAIPDALRATQFGAFSHLVKPVQKPELLDHASRAIAVSEFPRADRDLTSDLVARAKLMDERIAQFNQAAGSSDGLLITGESGAGKELLARAIHAASDRRHRPFVTVNCRISVESWLERELFGPKDGTTDGALARVRGGTLLIDEVGNLPASLQQRFLQEIGNFRLICTTSCGLTTLVDIGQLSKEVYDRIGHHQIDLPPLGRRREDIPRIISHFLEQAVDSPGGSPLYSIETIQRLATADWPENVQRLFELVKQNASLSTHTNVTDNPDSDVPTFEEARDKFSRDYLASNLRITRGNVSQSARLAKRNRTDFYKLLARYRLQPDDFKNPSEDRMFDDVI